MWQAELGDAPNRVDEQEEAELAAAAETSADAPQTQELTWYASAHEYWDDEANCP